MVDGTIKGPNRSGLHSNGAGNETRTRDPNLGKVMLYQLSYSRARDASYPARSQPRKIGGRKWRPLGESNPCRRDENPVS